MAKLPNPQLANEQARQAPVRFGSLHTLPQGMTLTILGHNASSSLSDASLGGSDLHPLLPAPGTAAPHDDCLRICPRERHTEDVGFVRGFGTFLLLRLFPQRNVATGRVVQRARSAGRAGAGAALRAG